MDIVNGTKLLENVFQLVASAYQFKNREILNMISKSLNKEGAVVTTKEFNLETYGFDSNTLSLSRGL